MRLLPLRQEQELPALPQPTPLPERYPSPAQASVVPAAGLRDYLRAVMHKWRVLLGAGALGCLAGLLITCFQTPSYRAKTSIEIQSINGDFLNMKQSRPMSDDPQGADAMLELQTQIEVLQSDLLAENTTQALAQAAPRKQWTAQTSLWSRLVRHGAPKTPSVQQALEKTADTRKVKEIGQTRLIQVQVDSPNPQLASDFANALVTEYIQQNTRAKWQMAEAAEELTRAQLADMRRKLEASERQLQKYAADHGLVFTSERQSIADDRIKQVQSEVLRAQTDLAYKQARKDLLSASQADNLPDISGETDLRSLRARLVDLRRQEAELLTVFKPEYSDVQKVHAQAEEIERAMNRERERIARKIENEYNESSEKEKLLQGAYQAAIRRATTESQIAVEYEVIKREVDTNLTAYQSMLTRVKDLSLAAAIRTSNVRVVDPAKPPESPFSPKLPVNVGLGLFTGLALAAGLVLLKEQSNQSLRFPGEAVVRLGVPELGVIPSAKANLPKAEPWLLGNTAGSSPLSLNLDSTAPPVFSPTGDGFRAVMASVMFSGTGNFHPKVVVVTSCSPQEGKTTVASNLAVALSRAGKRVLLIDGDLRRPQIHKLFGVPNHHGFGNLLQNGCTPLQAQQAIVNNLDPLPSILPSGSSHAVPTDLLFESHILTLLRTYREQFEILVIDTPPMMQIPDARILGRHSDGVILVARANQTPRSSLMMACHQLRQDRAPLLGIVLNDWDGKVSPYSPYYTD